MDREGNPIRRMLTYSAPAAILIILATLLDSPWSIVALLAAGVLLILSIVAFLRQSGAGGEDHSSGQGHP